MPFSMAPPLLPLAPTGNVQRARREGANTVYMSIAGDAWNKAPFACGCRLVELKFSPLLTLVEEDVSRDVLQTVNSKNQGQEGKPN